MRACHTVVLVMAALACAHGCQSHAPLLPMAAPPSLAPPPAGALGPTDVHMLAEAFAYRCLAAPWLQAFAGVNQTKPIIQVVGAGVSSPLAGDVQTDCGDNAKSEREVSNALQQALLNTGRVALPDDATLLKAASDTLHAQQSKKSDGADFILQLGHAVSKTHYEGQAACAHRIVASLWPNPFTANKETVWRSEMNIKKLLLLPKGLAATPRSTPTP